MPMPRKRTSTMAKPQAKPTPSKVDDGGLVRRRDGNDQRQERKSTGPEAHADPSDPPVALSDAEISDFELNWANVPYDGIKGNPPPWLPDWFRSEFERIRSFHVLYIEWEKRFTYAELREMFEWELDDLVDGTKRISHLPNGDTIVEGFAAPNSSLQAHAHGVRFLARLFHATQLGKVAGLRFLGLGGAAARSIGADKGRAAQSQRTADLHELYRRVIVGQMGFGLRPTSACRSAQKILRRDFRIDVSVETLLRVHRSSGKKPSPRKK